MTRKQKRHIIASAGTILFMALVFLVLWFVRMYSIQTEQEEGIEVAFGEVEEAGGYMEEQSEAVPLPAEEAVPETSSTPSENELMTQEDEEALALREKQRAEEEKARKEREKKERERREREAKEAVEAAEREKQAAEINQLGALFGQTGNTSGSGSSQGDGQRGNPLGHGSSGGHDWSLSGRSLKGTLPQPSNNFKQEGRVIVEIRVNAAGQVVSARVKGGNISDTATTNLALDAARKARFTEGDHDQIGTITYNFKFN